MNARLIDPPSAFAPREEWTRYRVEMEALAKRFPDDIDVANAVAIAKQEEAGRQ